MSNFDVIDMPQIKGMKAVRRNVIHDSRGYFVEMFRAELDLPMFVQTNQSLSNENVIRGMHFQSENPQGKLVSCLSGHILDVVFDMRPKSPTFKKSFSIELSSETLNSLYVPAGCAHGFLVLSGPALVQYKCTTYYDPISNSGFHWKSPEVRECFLRHIQKPLVSEKDDALPTFESYLSRLH